MFYVAMEALCKIKMETLENWKIQALSYSLVRFIVYDACGAFA